MEFEGGGGEKEGSSLLTQYETKGAAWKSVLIVAAGLTTVCMCVLGGGFYTVYSVYIDILAQNSSFWSCFY